MEWPPYSPDMSPIENLWGIIKKKLHSVPVTSKPDLNNEVHKIWQNDEEILSNCKKLIESMPRQIEECLKAKAGYTRY